MPPRQAGFTTLFSSDLFQFFTFILLFVALLYGQQGLVLLSLLILFMFTGARLWSRVSLGRINCRLSLQRERIFPGDVTMLEAQMTNRKFLPVWLQLAVIVNRSLVAPGAAGSALQEEHGREMPVNSADSTAIVSPGGNYYLVPPDKDLLWGEGGVLWQQESCWSWELTAQRRGVFDAGPLHLAAGDLFGFYAREKVFSQRCPVIVYPRLVPLNIWQMPLRELFGVPGGKSAVVDPVYPIATRDYQEGRPARHIHWKASARHGRLQEKVFEPSAQQRIMLAVDVEQYQQMKAGEAFERTLEVAASLAVELEQRGRSFGLVSNGTTAGQKIGGLPALLPPGKGFAQLLHLLELLARLQPESGQDMAELLFAGAFSPHGATCVYLTHDPAKLDGNIRDCFSRMQMPVVYIGSSSDAYPGTDCYPLEALLAGEAA